LFEVLWWEGKAIREKYSTGLKETGVAPADAMVDSEVGFDLVLGEAFELVWPG